MSHVWLLDVNVLLGWLWPAHEAHKAIRQWMSQHDQEYWATCPITQMGFLRIVSNRAFSPHAPLWPEALNTLRKQIDGSSNHCFWQDSLPLAELDLRLGSRINGPKQITGAYLLTLAMHNQGRMVTLDYRMHSLAPQGSAEHAALVILQV